MKKHMENSLKIAEALLNNPNVQKVIYPGKCYFSGGFQVNIRMSNKIFEALKCHPQHDLYMKQMSGFSGILSMYIKGDLETAQNFVKSLRVR
jgi:cystathionine beta-lyase/cystathionine gamma-synthase